MNVQSTLMNGVFVLRKKLLQENNDYWLVSYDDIDFDGLERSGYKPFRLAIRGLTVNQISLDGREMIYRHGLYRGEVVQALQFEYNITPTELIKMPGVLVVFRQVVHYKHYKDYKHCNSDFSTTKQSSV